MHIWKQIEKMVKNEFEYIHLVIILELDINMDICIVVKMKTDIGCFGYFKIWSIPAWDLARGMYTIFNLMHQIHPIQSEVHEGFGGSTSLLPPSFCILFVL